MFNLLTITCAICFGILFYRIQANIQSQLERNISLKIIYVC